MPDDKLMKSILDSHRALDTGPYASVIIEEATRASRAIAEKLRNITGDPSLKLAMEIIQKHEHLTRAAFGPLSELHRPGVLGLDRPWIREMELARKAMESYNARFELPRIAETAKLLAMFKNNSLSGVMARYAELPPSLARAMEGMRTPWLDIQEKMRSIAGFAEIQGIGHALRTMPAFDEGLAVSLRAGLGDWRDRITWRPEIFTDLAVRSDFYVNLGFNPALTDFPLPAFEQSLDIAGLRRRPSPVQGPPNPVGQDDDDDGGEEEGLGRTNEAHDSLQRLERMFRRFINAIMTQSFGDGWAKHRLPNGLYDQWREKKRKAEEAGAEERALIEYTDFTDYEAVICRRDNWRDLFGTIFIRQESVRESFQRLHPIRLDVAHSRLITQDDELLLRVEFRRLVKVMRKRGV